MIAASVAQLFRDGDAARYMSGALLRNVVDRAKTRAIKHVIGGGARGLSTAHLLAACDQELVEARSVAAREFGQY
jgi:proteasome-associated ATPase